jgi:murein DD-endopeptidase MepM/ murein hydrolase activator NlpD
MKRLIITEDEKREIRRKYGLNESLPELDAFPVGGGSYNIGYDEDWDNFNSPMSTANSDFSKEPTYSGVGGHLKGHFGIDIFGPKGTPILAPIDGIVKHNDSNGKTIIIEDPETGYSHWLGHLDSRIAEDGDFVTAGDKVGTLGDSGNATGTAPHLHYNIYKTSSGFESGEDPLNVLKKAIGKTGNVSKSSSEPTSFTEKLKNMFLDVFGEKGKDGDKKISAKDEKDLFGKLKDMGGMFYDKIKGYFA